MLNSVTWPVGPGKPACGPSLPEGRASGTGLAVLVLRAGPKMAEKGRSRLLTASSAHPRRGWFGLPL